VLHNLRVLATDQSTGNETAAGKTVVRTFHSVTLEVTPKIAEKIEVAQAIGSLSLTLRSLADNQSDLDRAIASGSLKLPDGATKADEDRAWPPPAVSPGYRGHAHHRRRGFAFPEAQRVDGRRAARRLPRRGPRSHRPQRARDARFVHARAFDRRQRARLGAGRGAAMPAAPLAQP
jgi:Flp pilus assembly protein CpaB